MDNILIGEYEIHMYYKVQKAFVKWSGERPDGAGVLKEEREVAGTENGRQVCCMYGVAASDAFMDAEA